MKTIPFVTRSKDVPFAVSCSLVQAFVPAVADAIVLADWREATVQWRALVAQVVQHAAWQSDADVRLAIGRVERALARRHPSALPALVSLVMLLPSAAVVRP